MIKLTKPQRTEVNERLKYIKEHDLGATSSFLMINNVVHNYDVALEILKKEGPKDA